MYLQLEDEAAYDAGLGLVSVLDYVRVQVLGLRIAAHARAEAPMSRPLLQTTVAV